MWSVSPSPPDNRLSNTRRRSLSFEEWCNQLSFDLKNTRTQVDYLSRYIVHLREKINSLEQRIENHQCSPSFPAQQLVPSHATYAPAVNANQQAFCLPHTSPNPAPVVVLGRSPCVPGRSYGVQHSPQQIQPDLPGSTSSDKENSFADSSRSPSLEEEQTSRRGRSRTNREPSPVVAHPPQPSSSHKKRRRSFIVPLALRRNKNRVTAASNASVSDAGSFHLPKTKSYTRR